MVKFKYKIDNGLLPLVQNLIVDFYDNTFTGYLPEGLSGQMQHCTLFIVCEFEEINSTQVYKNPIVVVARNDGQAVQIYQEVTGNIGFVLHRISEDCSKIKVEVE
jgi:hypothetical protein